MFKIFISYRRGDTRDVAQRIFERISKQFGTSVFCDVDGIKLGDNFREALQRAVAECDVMVVVIGLHWFGTNADGTRRIDDPNDWVYREVKTALERNIAVIPVYIHPAQRPGETELPLLLKDLASRESITVYADKQFESSIRTVVDALVSMQERRAGILERMSIKTRRWFRSVRQPASIAIILAFASCAAFGTWWYREKFDNKGRRVDPTVVNTWEKADLMKLQKEIDAMKARAPAPTSTRQTNTQSVPSLGTPDYSSFDILSDERFWDLRGWKDLSLPENKGEKSFVIMIRSSRIQKATAAQEIRFEGRTDGDELFLTSLSPRDKWHEILQQQSGFVGARAMKVRQLVLDVSDAAEFPVGNEFLIRTQATYWNSLQNSADRWIGAIGYPRSDRIRFVVLLPDKYPLKSFRLQTSPSTREKSEDYKGPLRLIESKDKLSLMWEIPNPQVGYVYTILMEW